MLFGARSYCCYKGMGKNMIGLIVARSKNNVIGKMVKFHRESKENRSS